MTENTENTVSPDELLLADALAQFNKSANRVPTKVLLASVVAFCNSGDKTMKHFEQKYPTVTVARLRSMIKSNDAINGKVWPIENDNFGICLVKIPKA